MKTFLLALSLCLALPLLAAAADVSGKWSGSFTPETGDGASAYVILTQTGNKLTGSGGPDANTQWPGLEGAVSGNNITFQVKSADDGTVYKCTVVLDGDRLKGDVQFTTPDGQAVKAKLDLTRVPQ